MLIMQALKCRPPSQPAAAAGDLVIQQQLEPQQQELQQQPTASELSRRDEDLTRGENVLRCPPRRMLAPTAV